MHSLSRHVISLWAAWSFLQPAAARCGPAVEKADLFAWEKVQLTDATLEGLDDSVARLFAFYNATAPTGPRHECKVFPGDADWPEDSVWSKFNELAGGQLLHPRPEASVCYEGPTFDTAACDLLTANWTNSYERMKDPLEVFWPTEVGLTCLPPAVIETNGCTQGGYPVYVVNITNVAQIQLAVNFARNTGVRFVIKNTGHDFMGKSSGAGALSVWTHNLKDIVFYGNYSAPGYNGPAFKVGAGVQLFEIYKVARTKGLMVVGGEGQTIGAFGGYTQGGGHSPLSSLYGLGADQVLAIEVVTPDGRFVSATADGPHSDLFWAMRGGGGGTYGVATSMVIRAYRDVAVTASTFTIDSAAMGLSADAFWAVVDSFFSHFPRFVAAGTYSYLHLTSDPLPSLNIGPFFAPGLDIAQSVELIAPFLSDLAALGIDFEPEWIHYESFYDAWLASFPLELVELPRFASSSRLWPRPIWDDAAERGPKFRAMMDAIRYTVEEHGIFLNGFHMGPRGPAGWDAGADSIPDNAVTPAWRDTYCHLIAGTGWGPDTTDEEQMALRLEFTNVYMKRWRDASPGGGSYMNEADRLEPDFQHSFFGSHYERLLEIKQKYDPEEVFWAVTAVGSDAWAVRSVDGLPNENGKLCRVD